LAQVVGQIAEHHVAQWLVGVLGDGPNFSDVFLAKASRDHVDDPAAKAREALTSGDHERADDEWKPSGPRGAEPYDVIKQAADIFGLFLGDVFPTDVRWGL
jgi:hypothetical protein